MPLFKFSKTQKRKIAVFLSSLGLASLLWIFYALSSTYVYPGKLQIRWTEVPASIRIKNGQTDSLNTNINGSGWQLLWNKIKPQQQNVSLSLKNWKEYNYIPLKSQIGIINEQMPAGQKVVGLDRDTLFFKPSNSISKEVPVRFVYQLGFEPFYGLSEPIQITPASVSITGTIDELENIKYLTTEKLEKTGINTSFSQLVALKPFSQSVQIEPQWVMVNVPVSGYTEKVIMLDVQVKNKPQDTRLKLLPAKVKLTINTSLSNYAKLSAADFEAYVDFNLWQTKNMQQLPIKFARIPNFIRILKTEPQTLDFIIEP